MWTKEKVVEDACDFDNRMINQNHEDLDSWAMELRIIKRQKHVIAETFFFQVKTKASACALRENQKEHCDSNDIRIVSKETSLECAKKVGF